MRLKTVTLLFVLLFFPTLIFSQSHLDPIQAEIEASLCDVDETELIRTLELKPNTSGWVLYYDTLNQDYQKNQVTLRLRIRSKKNPEATVKARSFGTWSESEKQEVLRAIPADHDFKMETDLYVNQSSAPQDLWFTSLISKQTLSIEYELDKSSELFSEKSVADWIRRRLDSPGESIPFDCPFSDSQENLAMHAALQRNLPDLQPKNVFSLMAWKAPESSGLEVQKREMILPKNHAAIYEVTKKVQLSHTQSMKEAVHQFKTQLISKGLVLCSEFISARALMAWD